MNARVGQTLRFIRRTALAVLELERRAPPIARPYLRIAPGSLLVGMFIGLFARVFASPVELPATLVHEPNFVAEAEGRTPSPAVTYTLANPFSPPAVVWPHATSVFEFAHFGDQSLWILCNPTLSQPSFVVVIRTHNAIAPSDTHICSFECDGTTIRPSGIWPTILSWRYHQRDDQVYASAVGLKSRSSPLVLTQCDNDSDLELLFNTDIAELWPDGSMTTGCSNVLNIPWSWPADNSPQLPLNASALATLSLAAARLEPPRASWISTTDRLNGQSPDEWLRRMTNDVYPQQETPGTPAARPSVLHGFAGPLTHWQDAHSSAVGRLFHWNQDDFLDSMEIGDAAIDLYRGGVTERGARVRTYLPQRKGRALAEEFALSDLNGDGLKDLVARTEETSWLAYLANADGTFGTKQITGAFLGRPLSLHESDVVIPVRSNDDRARLLTVDTSFDGLWPRIRALVVDPTTLIVSEEASWWSPFLPKTIRDMARTTRIKKTNAERVDFNGDGCTDFIASNGGNLDILLTVSGDNQCQYGTFHLDLNGTCTHWDVDDLDHDGKTDIVAITDTGALQNVVVFLAR